MREPIVAGRFYPGSAAELSRDINTFLPDLDESDQSSAYAAIAPHAGYMYSGELAAKTLGSVSIPESVLLIGPKHHGRGAPIALSSEAWQTPLGTVQNDRRLTEFIDKQSTHIQIDEQAHAHEHSLEVLLPFLQVLRTNLCITPLAVAQIQYQTCEEIAKALASALTEAKTAGQEVLIVASTDMNHYESRQATDKKDNLALQAIREMNAKKLYSTVLENNISMCGVIPVVITLLTSQILGAETSTLIGHTDSGEASGDTSQVVGYAGIVIN